MLPRSEAIRHPEALSSESGDAIDFSRAAYRAYQKTPVLRKRDISSGIMRQIDEWAGAWAPLADTDSNEAFHEPEPNQVITRMVSLYPRMMQQTLEVLWPRQAAPKRKIDGWLEHELQHAEAALTVNPLVALFYGMQIHRSKEQGPMTIPFVEVQGHMRKIDMAFIAIAPTEPSPGDLRIVQALGYDSPQEVRERHAALS